MALLDGELEDWLTLCPSRKLRHSGPDNGSRRIAVPGYAPRGQKCNEARIF